MKGKFLLSLLSGASAIQAQTYNTYGAPPASYGYAPAAPASYGAPPAGYGYAPAAPAGYGYAPAAPAGYGYAPAAPAGYGYAPAPAAPAGYGGYGYSTPAPTPEPVQPYTSHFQPAAEIPYPYTAFPTQQDSNILSIPVLGDYHCFLTGAPWTSCGRKTLTSYFLEQCLTFYFQMSANVDGICGGEPPKPEPRPDSYNDNYYSSDYQGAPSEPEPRVTSEPRTPAPTTYYQNAATPAPTTYGQAQAYNAYEATSLSPEYLKEKCLQQAYVSITSATVMCLTENLIRLNYIEYYAADACNNPIEGPILYLRKMHSFIEKVLKCTGDDAKNNFPNLYRTFKEGDTISYNPNAPFYLDGDRKLAMQQYTSAEASGIEAYTVGQSFMCADPSDLSPNTNNLGTGNPAYIYTSLPNTPHYSPSMYPECTTSSANTALGDSVYRFCKNPRWTTDQTLNGLYDAVHYTESTTTSLHRPQTIAEIAVRSAGVREQPILEGFGIMYYCAFYACAANNGGDVDGTCYPEFDSEKDWTISSSITEYSNLQKLSNQVNACVLEGWLTSDDISGDSTVQSFTSDLAARNYLCMAENEIVSFLALIYPGWACEDDATQWVYGRYLADERCYTDQASTCTSYSNLYEELQTALTSLLSTCTTNQIPTPEPTAAPVGYGYAPQAPAGYGYQAPAPPSNYGYQAPAPPSNYGYQAPAPPSNYGYQAPAPAPVYYAPPEPAPTQYHQAPEYAPPEPAPTHYYQPPAPVPEPEPTHYYQAPAPPEPAPTKYYASEPTNVSG